MSTPFIGQVSLFAGNFAPRGWQLCAGQILSIAQNTALFSILGTTYGGNGTTTFALPDLRGRVAIGVGQGPGLSYYNIGEMAGTENVTLLTTQMPQHNHLMLASNQPGGSANPSNNFLADINEPTGSIVVNGYTPAATNTSLNPASISLTGGNQPFGIMQPYLG
ncbi:phage tail protein [Methylocucumis oryzae]|uniref:phage tail protein n=1 Tax=Methylocucumis oryzae TaxID=1632867 RepID=UPI000AB54F08|nr:tail fiber protein [Methylocucumis oryzae]